MPDEAWTCIFTNTRPTGPLKSTKSRDPLPSGFTGTCAVNRDCDDGTAHDGTINFAAGASSTICGIPTVTTCAVSEPVAPIPPTGWTVGAPSCGPASVSLVIAAK